MTYSEIAAVAEETGLPYAYDHFAEGESPEPPFLVFILPREAHFYADGRIYTKTTALYFELYTDAKDPTIEAYVEEVLQSHGINYEKSETWIETEKLYEVIYEMEVPYGEQD